MPSYVIIHKHCGGEVRMFPPLCKKCKKRWPLYALFIQPKDIKILPVSVKRETTSHAKWADKVPYAGQVAGYLPNWPRWARIVATLTWIVFIIGIIAFAIKACSHTAS